MTVDKRMGELMMTKIKDLPPLALEYRNHLCQRYGGCMEVMLTAFAHYAELVEGCEKSEDEAYRADLYAMDWFKEKRGNSEGI